MNDVRTLAAARRRRARVRAQVGLMVLRVQAQRLGASFAGLRTSAAEASEQILDAVATVDVQLMWEQACADPDA